MTPVRWNEFYRLELTAFLMNKILIRSLFGGSLGTRWVFLFQKVNSGSKDTQIFAVSPSLPTNASLTWDVANVPFFLFGCGCRGTFYHGACDLSEVPAWAGLGKAKANSAILLLTLSSSFTPPWPQFPQLPSMLWIMFLSRLPVGLALPLLSWQASAGRTSLSEAHWLPVSWE